MVTLARGTLVHIHVPERTWSCCHLDCRLPASTLLRLGTMRLVVLSVATLANRQDTTLDLSLGQQLIMYQRVGEGIHANSQHRTDTLSPVITPGNEHPH